MEQDVKLTTCPWGFWVAYTPGDDSAKGFPTCKLFRVLKMNDYLREICEYVLYEDGLRSG